MTDHYAFRAGYVLGFFVGVGFWAICVYLLTV